MNIIKMPLSIVPLQYDDALSHRDDETVDYT